jgi:hypothetical protein
MYYACVYVYKTFIFAFHMLIASDHGNFLCIST